MYVKYLTCNINMVMIFGLSFQFSTLKPYHTERLCEGNLLKQQHMVQNSKQNLSANTLFSRENHSLDCYSTALPTSV